MGDYGQFTSLKDLSSRSNRFRIKARVSAKSDLRPFKNGGGKLFSIDLVDAGEGETRGTFFNEAADKFYDRIEAGKVYTFSRGKVKLANKQYWSRSECEITFDEKSEICESRADDSTIPSHKYDFKPLQAVSDRDIPVNATVDVKAVVMFIDDVRTLTRRTAGGGEVNKLSMSISDESGVMCEFTIWGEKADDYHEELKVGDVVFIKSARVGDFGGRPNLSFNSITKVEVIDPGDPRAYSLSRWYAEQEQNSEPNTPRNSRTPRTPRTPMTPTTPRTPTTLTTSRTPMTPITPRTPSSNLLTPRSAHATPSSNRAGSSSNFGSSSGCAYAASTQIVSLPSTPPSGIRCAPETSQQVVVVDDDSSDARVRELTDGLLGLFKEERRRRIEETQKRILAEKKLKEESAKRLKIESDAEETYKCIICFEKRRDSVFLPCKHLNCCHECSEELLARRQRKCPTCRAKATKVIKVFTG